MSDKYIDNSAYITSGYTISGTNLSITIGSHGIIGGPGIIGGTIEAYTLVNRGTVSGEPGIELQHGGSITNNGTGALIEGTSDIVAAIHITGGEGIVGNTGTILGNSFGGISLASGGTVTNSGGAALIEGGSYGGVDINGGAGVVSNSGTILGVANFVDHDVYLGAGGIVSNAGASALIETTSDYGSAVLIAGAPGTVSNGGTIESGTTLDLATQSIGIELKDGGRIANAGTAALIEGHYFGIYSYSGTASVTNSGRILADGGPNAIGVFLRDSGGTVDNVGTAALIEGIGKSGYANRANAGVWIKGASGTVINGGTILAAGTISSDGSAGVGVLLTLGGIVTNTGPKSLIAGYSGVVFGRYATGTVVNAGTIASTRGPAGIAVDFVSDGDVLVDEAGSRFIGTVQGYNSALELTGTSGTIKNLATSFVGFGTVSLEMDSRWTFEGNNSITSALYLGAGASLTNAGTLMLVDRPETGPGDGVYLAAGAGLTNTGKVIADNGYVNGVLFSEGGKLSNAAAAFIEGGVYGVAILGGIGSVANAGTILGGERSGVALFSGGDVINSDVASLIEGYAGVAVAFGVSSTVTNQGTIVGRYGIGVYLEPGGKVNNTGAKALIRGTTGVELTGVGEVGNSGTITGNSGYPGIGVYLYSGGTVDNSSSAALIAGVVGVDVEKGAATIDNFGTIAAIGGGTIAVALAAASDVLIDEAGSHFVGAVEGGGGTLKLSGAGGSLTGLGSSFSGFGKVDVLAGARWTLEGTNVLARGTAVTLADAGSLTVTGVSTASGTISGAGTLVLVGIETMAAGTALDVAHLTLAGGRLSIDTTLTDAGAFIETAGTLGVTGGVMTLKGAAAFNGGTIVGNGTLASGIVQAMDATVLTALTVDGGAVLRDYGKLTQTGKLSLVAGSGRPGSLVVEAGGTLALQGLAAIAGASGQMLNEGLLERNAGGGTSVLAPTLTNTGTIQVSAGTLDIAGSLGGSGHDRIDASSVLSAAGPVAAAQTIVFAGSNASLHLLDASAFLAAIDGLDQSATGDTIIATTFTTGTKVTFTQSKAGETVAALTDGTKKASIALFGQFTAADFHYTASASGTAISYTPPSETAALATPHR